jgi:dipeptidase E
MERKLLLISNSTNPGEEYLGWPRKYIGDFLKASGIQDVLFIPYAGVNLVPSGVRASFDLYEKRVDEVFRGMGFRIHSIHREADPDKAVIRARAIAVGGGNTFHLVRMMHETGIMKKIRQRVLKGIPYLGWSAGANVACPTMKTTNDMPISQPASFSCLGLVPFQINPHYLDANPAGHGGETREQRILEFLTLNRKVYVAGLREATLLRIEGDSIRLMGRRPMRVFRFGSATKEYSPGANIRFLLH